jgi:hypothetical protein
LKHIKHCEECIQKLGEPFGEVHEWLDEFAAEFFPLLAHRIERHHSSGIEEVRLKWGDKAAEAARLHIIADEGCVPEPHEIFKKYTKESKK